jgi:hypothetical protein
MTVSRLRLQIAWFVVAHTTYTQRLYTQCRLQKRYLSHNTQLSAVAAAKLLITAVAVLLQYAKSAAE